MSPAIADHSRGAARGSDHHAGEIPAQAGLPPPTVAELEDCDRRIVDRADRASRTTQAAGAIGLVQRGSLEGTPVEALNARDLVQDPIGLALENGLHQAGALLAERLETYEALLHRVKRICGRDQRNCGRRFTTIDSALSGVRLPDGFIWAS